jgi:hypothetical protein
MFVLHRHGSVGGVTVYLPNDLGSIPCWDKIFFIKSTASRPALGIKHPGRDADRSPPSSAEVKNCGATTAVSHTSSWRGVEQI